MRRERARGPARLPRAALAGGVLYIVFQFPRGHSIAQDTGGPGAWAILPKMRLSRARLLERVVAASTRDRPRWQRYGLAVTFGALSVLAGGYFPPALGVAMSLHFFYLAVTVSAWFGGLGPGLLATGLTGLYLVNLVKEPASDVASIWPKGVHTGTLFMTGVGISLLGELLRQARRREVSDRYPRWLAEAKARLGSSMDCEANLSQVARLAVPAFADGCVIHLLDRDGRMRLLTAFHAEEERLAPLEALSRRVADGEPSEEGPWNALRSGAPELITDAGSYYLARARELRARELLEQLDLGSSLSAPLIAGERRLGAITLFTSGSGRRLGTEDMELVRNLADCAAAAVDNARLFQEAQRLNRVKDELLSVFAHNLRTPLGSVLIWLELLRSERDEPDRARAMGMIDRSVRNLSQLLDQLQDVSRIITGKLRLDNQATDLAAVIDAVLESARPAAEAKSIRLEAKSDRSLGWVWADSNRLRQALQNLVSNAIQFTPAGGSVTVRLERAGDREGQARIQVQDTGIGMRPELLAVVLERFREGAESSRLHSGLGLAIARHIAELHQGRIRAESEGEGRGSVFTWELPLSRPPEGSVTRRQSPEETASSLLDSHRKTR